MTAPASGIINLGYIYSVGLEILPRIVERFYLHQGSRSIGFNFTQGMSLYLVDRLLEGRLDFVFTAPPDDALIDGLPVFGQDLFLVVPGSHPLAGRECAGLDEIRDENFISINPNTSLRRQLDNNFKEAGFTPKVVFEVDECNSMAAFIGARMGIAVMPRIPSLNDYNVSVVPIKPRLKREICLLWRKDRRMTPSACCFKNFVEHNKSLCQGASPLDPFRGAPPPQPPPV